MIVTNLKGTLKSGKEQQGFYMNGYMVSNLLGIKNYLKQEWDCVGIVSGHGKVRMGKCEVKGSKVLMSNGSWKNIENIKIGDLVISPQEDGTSVISKVLNTHHRFEEEVYGVYEHRRYNRLLYSCAGNHDVPILRFESEQKKGNKDKRISWLVRENQEARELAKKKDGYAYVFTSCPVEYNLPDSSMEPYCLGAFLGDGSFSSRRRLSKHYKGLGTYIVKPLVKQMRSGKLVNVKETLRIRKNPGIHSGFQLARNLNITSNDPEIMEEISKFYPISNVQHKSGTSAKTYRFGMNNEFAKELTRLGLEGKGSGDKFIPQECMASSIAYRQRLIAGLIDTDGYVRKEDSYISITTKSKQMAEDISNLVFSLGGHASLRSIRKKCQTGVWENYFTISISFQDPLFIQLKTNKRLNLKKRLNNPRNISIKIRKSKPQEVFGFELDSPSKLYVTDNWIVTHNSTHAFQVASFFAWILAGGWIDMEIVESGSKKTWKINKIINPKIPPIFNLKANVVFSAGDLQIRAQQLYTKYGKNQIIVYDEGREGLDAKRAMENLNKVMEDFFQECGFMGHIIIIVLPNFFKLHEDYAVSRSIFLIDCFADKKKKRGYYNFYDETQKEWLYFLGKKRIGITMKYSAASESFWGRYSTWFPFDKDEYNRLKGEALRKRRRTAKQINWKKQRDVLLYLYKQGTEKTNEKIAEEVTVSSGFRMSTETVDNAIRTVTKSYISID